jgi:hypothetical protein
LSFVKRPLFPSTLAMKKCFLERKRLFSIFNVKQFSFKLHKLNNTNLWRQQIESTNLKKKYISGKLPSCADENVCYKFNSKVSY